MNAERTLTALRVPTLTEVVAVAEPVAAATDPNAPTTQDASVPDEGHAVGSAPVDLQLDDVGPQAQPGLLRAAPAGRQTALPTDSQLIQQVLADVSRQVELMLEYRMRETLAPILARATDAMIRDTRNQLVNTLHEMVARAVAQEMARHRDR
jgi:hypothetical protein